MFVIIGAVIVIGCVFGAFSVHGDLRVLFQPVEFVIILGAAVGAFVIGNTKSNIRQVFKGLKRALKGPTFKKADYVELLSVLYQLFKLAKTKGMLALEQHVEKPDESALFNQFPKFLKDHHAVEFLCDYLRMMTLGTENPNEVETLMDAELETHHQELHGASHAMQTMADGMPALGIVAAVLGVIVTMGSITEPPKVLGELIGAALVGTFFGVLVSYGFIAPIANAIKGVDEADAKYYQCMKAGLLAHMQGYPPAVSVEFARKVLLSTERPNFYEVEQAVSALPPV
ncbi:MAG TPA: flagellar motor stator protein MotA [Dongiaceae bacterium]|jgi:chemotaxis protein MotA|nr:flagellar motor stator protein MotA [Dongiaceae bacterium]HEU4825195.1 flagellar motor stator protein MotA [Dongiaceae bacterium]